MLFQHVNMTKIASDLLQPRDLSLEKIKARGNLFLWDFWIVWRYASINRLEMHLKEYLSITALF